MTQPPSPDDSTASTLAGNATPPPFRFIAGTRPLLVSMPHVGTFVPPPIAARLSDEARQVPDTDWHLEQLYAFATELGASILVATHSRYVIDLNRPPDNASLYPGQATTELCPLATFDGGPVYRDQGDQPDSEETAGRLQSFWKPYHDALRDQLQAMVARHGNVGLWEAHSIRSVLPRFFPRRLPDLNIGTADGHSCSPVLAQRIEQCAREAEGFTSVLNGRYKGGYITRRFGDPVNGVHAVQLEKTQCSYMTESLPFTYLPDRAARLQPHLRRMLQTMLDFVERDATQFA